MELNPGHAEVHILYAQFLYCTRRFEESLPHARLAQQLAPGSLRVNTWAGTTYFLAGRVDEAMAAWQKALELDPGYPDASVAPAQGYVALGRLGDAIAALEKGLVFSDREPLVMGVLAHAYALAGRREEALKLVGELRRMEARMNAEGKSIPRFAFVWAYAGLGVKERAFAWLEKAYQERRDRMVALDVDPLLDPLRADPRFQDLLRRVGLPSR